MSAVINLNYYKKQLYEQISIISSVEDMNLYKGKFRLCAIDGCDLALENERELIEYFGCFGSKKDACTGITLNTYICIIIPGY